MTYRCVDCVYSERIIDTFCDMKCLKHNETVKCMNNHCDDLILKPFQLISHLCFVTNRKHYRDYTWNDADRLAAHLLNGMSFAGMTLSEQQVLFTNTSGKRPDDEEIEKGGS